MGHLRVGDGVIDSIILPWTSWFSLSFTQGSVPGLMFGSMSCDALQAHIALSEPMTSIVQQGPSLGSSSTPPSLNLHYNRPTGHWPCVTSCLVGGRDKYHFAAGFSYLCQNGVWVLTTNPSCRMWGQRPYQQPKQKSWNPTDHSHRPSTANQSNNSSLFSHSNSSSQC